MTDRRDKLPEKARQAELDAFLRQVAAAPKPSLGRGGRLIFAMDATASREPSWKQAAHIQSQMFRETVHLGGLQVQLCYYRGLNELHATPWEHDAEAVLAHMRRVTCVGGLTQIERVLRHAVTETRTGRVHALVLVGDCIEEEVDRVCAVAGQLGLLGVPAFMFQEGVEAEAERAFRQVAGLTHGAYCPFDANSAEQLKDLLAAAAVYAAGGSRALAELVQRKGGAVAQLTHQLRRD